MKIKTSTTTSLVWLAGGLISCVSAKAILGVDLGSLYMKVALVQRGAPLEIVTNLHSKRKTEQMILFDQGSRFYGADASSLVARKPTQTPLGMSVMLGRDEDHPAVKVCTGLRMIRADWNAPVSNNVCGPFPHTFILAFFKGYD
jgi:molecular chaperone DnaK (HSP70)